MTNEEHLRRIYKGLIKTATKKDTPKTEDEFVKSALIRQSKK